MIGDFDKDIEIDGFGLGQEEESGPSILENLKKYIKPIILILAVAIIGYLAYYFFYASLIDTTIDVKIGERTINTKISLLENSDVKYELDSGDTKKIRGGSYNIRINSIPNGYYLPTNYRFIDIESDTTKTIYLEPEYTKGLELETIIPQTLYSEQIVNQEIIIRSTGEANSIFFKGKGYFEDKIDDTKSYSLNGAETKIVIDFKVDEGEDNINGQICIRETSNCIDVDVDVEDTPNVDFEVVGSSNIDVKSGESASINLQVDNRYSQVSLSNLSFDIVSINSTGNLGEEDIKSMFKLPNSINVNANDTYIVKIDMNIPFGYNDTEFSFKVKAKNSFIEIESEQINISIEEPNVKTNSEIDFDNILAGTVSKKEVTIENNTSYLLEIRLISSDNYEGIENNTRNEVKSWTQIGEVENVEPKESETFELVIDTNNSPHSKDESYEFDVIINTNAGDLIVPVSVSLKELVVDIEISFESDMSDKINIDFDETNNTESKAGFLEVKNNSEVEILLQDLSISSQCIGHYEHGFESHTLEANKTRSYSLIIPAGEFNNNEGDIITCDFSLEYFNPKIRNTDIIPITQIIEIGDKN